MKDVHKNWLLALVSVVLGLLVAEVTVRIALPDPGFFPFNSPAGMLIPHPDREYAYAPEFSARTVTADYDIQVETNSLGLRDDPLVEGSAVDVLAVGDSFTVGFGVEANEAWPSRLEEYLNSRAGVPGSLRVVNGGVSGYNLTQIHLLLTELLELKPRLVILGLYPSGSSRISNPFVLFGGEAVPRSLVPRLKIVGGGFIRTPIYRKSLQPLYFWFAQYFHAGAYALDGIRQAREWMERPAKAAVTPSLYATGAELQSLLTEVGSIRDTLIDHGIPLVVLVVNKQAADGSFEDRQWEYDRIITSYCEERGIPVFRPLPALAEVAAGRPIHRIGADHHWSAGAHAIVGTELGNFLIEKNLISALGVDNGGRQSDLADEK